MAVKLRLARGGSKKRPFYSIVVADERMPRDGRYIEKLGTYNPMLPKDGDRVTLNKERAEYWLSKGAQPTDRVLRFLDAEGMMKRQARNNPKKALPGKKAQERLAEAEAKKEEKAAAAAAAEEEAKAAEQAAAEAPAEEAPAEEAPAEEAALAEEGKAEEAKADEAAPAEETPAEASNDDAGEADGEAAGEDAIPFVDNIVLIDGIGDKTAEALIAEGVGTLTAVAQMSDEDLAALCEKVGAGQQWQSKEWKVQAQEMIDGKPPRSKVDQDLAKKLAKEAG